jgi:23S rRNA (adenine2503-C2)-methyltransferase
MHRALTNPVWWASVTRLPSIYDQTLESLIELMRGWGEPDYRARQIWHALYAQLVVDPGSLTATPQALRQRLADHFSFSTLQAASEKISSDGNTTKMLLSLPDGAPIEAVLMRYENRQTACISSQAGCAMGCVFCATGQMGLLRNLSAGEIVEQVLIFARTLSPEGERLTHIVLMGMGEPFHNYAATMEAIDRLNHPDGFNFGARRFTISSVGLVPFIERFTSERRQVNLAISLHAASNDVRNRIIPVAARYPLEVLIPVCRSYVEHTGRRITFEWAMIHDVNDTLEQAEALASLVKGLNCHVNLIPLNPTRNFPGEASSRERVDAFSNLLKAHGISCTVRVRRGIDIQAGCGQLVADRRMKTSA